MVKKNLALEFECHNIVKGCGLRGTSPLQHIFKSTQPTPAPYHFFIPVPLYQDEGGRVIPGLPLSKKKKKKKNGNGSRSGIIRLRVPNAYGIVLLSLAHSF